MANETVVTKPPTPTQIVKAKEEAIIKQTMAMPLKGKKRLVASTLGTEADWFKLLLQGHTGTGKTLFLAGVLQCVNADGSPNKVFVASTDIGGQGLRSVREYLRSIGREDLISNVKFFEFTRYEDFAAFTTNPNVIDIDGQDLWSWNPDVIMLDGLANFQESHVWRYIMAMDPLAKDSHETRDAGVQAGIAEWGQIRRATILQIDQFLTLHNPSGKKIHKLVTVLLDSGKESKITHESKIGPLIMGAARDYVGPAFDAIITTQAIVKIGQKEPLFRFQCEVASTSTVAKLRGLKLPQEILDKADSKALWENLTK